MEVADVVLNLEISDFGNIVVENNDKMKRGR